MKRNLAFLLTDGCPLLPAIILFLLFGAASSAEAALRTWTGAGPNALWSTPSNWTPAGAPQDGEDLSFPSGALRRTNTNDLPARTFGFILFNGVNSDYELRGNAITLSRGMNAVNVPRPLLPQIFFEITLAQSLRFVADEAGVLFGRVDLAGHTLTLNTATSNSFFSAGAEIKGIGDVIKIGVGEVLFGGSDGNSYQGTTHVAEGTLRIGKGNGGPPDGVPGPLIIGDVENGFVTTRGRVELLHSHMINDASLITIYSGTLDLNGFEEAVAELSLYNAHIVTGTNTLRLLDRVVASTIVPVIGSTIEGHVSLETNVTLQVFSSAGVFYLSANVSGAGGITKEGGGTVAMAGSNIVNTFTGPLTVNDGMLYLSSCPSALNGVAGLTLGNAGVLGLEGVSFADKSLTINSAGAGLLANSQTITWNGPIHLNFNGTAKFNAGDKFSSFTLRIPGSIDGTGGIWFGGRTVELLGNNTFTGRVISACELLLLNTGAGRPFSGPLEVGGSYFDLDTRFNPLIRRDTNATAEVRWFRGGQNPNQPLTVRSNGFVNLNGNAESFSRIDFYGGRVIGSAELRGDVTVHPENATAILSGNVEFNLSRIFAISNTLVTVGLYMDGTISGLGGIIKTGPGLMWIDGTGTYSDRVVIEGGVLHADSSTALGARTAGTTVNAGGTLSLGSSAGFLGEPLSLAGGGSEGTNGALRSAFDIFITNNVVLTGPTTIRTEGTNSRIQIQGVISGVGPLTKVGSGVFGFRGNTDNIYSGDTIASEGTMRLTKPSGITSVPGHLVIGGGGGGLFGASAVAEQGASFTILGSVTVNRGGLWNLNGFSEGFTVPLLEGRPPLTLNSGGDVQTGAGSLVLPVGGDVVVNPGTGVTGASFISGNLGLDPGPHRFVVQSGVSGIGFDFAELDVSATVSQTSTAADIVKEGEGEMRLGAANSFTGPVTVNEGSLTAANALALGTAAGGVFVNGNAFLALDGGFEIAETLTLDSTNTAALLSLGPVTNVWSGNVILQRIAGIRVPDVRGALTHFGIPDFGVSAPNISGPGGFTKSGSGALFISGLQRGNSYTGPTTVTGGLLEAIRTRSLSSNVVVTGPNSVLRTGRSGNQFNGALTVLPVGASVTVQDGALWSMNATNSETISRLVGNGRLEIGAGGALTITNDVDCTFSGPLSGGGALNKRGPAMLRLTADSGLFSGPATIFEGTYKVDGRIPSSPITVKSLATLRGGFAGSDVTVESGGRVEPDPVFAGQIGGALYMASGNFQAGASLGATFFGPDPTGGNDHLEVGNAVTLNNTHLNAEFAYAPREGDIITLVNNSGVGAITGTFNGLPEGTVQVIDEIPVVMSYVGGTGNDAILTVTNLQLRSGGAQAVSGNGGSVLVPDDCSQLWLLVTNRGAGAITGLRGRLRSLTEGLVVTIADAAFPNLAPNARGSNATPFQIRTDPTFACGAGAQIELLLTASNIPPMAIVYTFPGNAGTALAFNDSGNYVAVSHTTSLNPYPFTLTFWVKTLQSVGVAGLVNKYAAGSLNGWNINLRGGHPRAWYYRTSTNFVSRGTSGLDGGYVADGQWHHVAFTVDATGGKLYRDGELEESRAWTGVPIRTTTTQEIRLGNDAGNGVAFNGELDEVSLWRTALSQAQIQTNMHQGLTGLEADLVAYYRCDEASGAAVLDSAPNIGGDNHGAWVGTPLFAFSGVGPFNLPGGGDCNSGRGACESCVAVSGQFTTNAPQTARYIAAGALRSACDPPKPCPGFLESTGSPLSYVLHHFTNSTAAELCVTAQMRIGCPNPLPNTFGVAAYVGAFLANEPCSNYLGDDGAFGAVPPPFSFRVPPRTNFLVVVTARTGEPVCENYTLELFGLPCPPPRLDLARDTTPGKVLLQWSSAYPDYRLQSVNSLNNPGPHPFTNVITPPVLIGGKFAVTNAIAAPRRLFRLTK